MFSRKIFFLGSVLLLGSILVVSRVYGFGQWPNAPLAIPTDGYVGTIFTGPSPNHNGVDIWTDYPSGKGNADRNVNLCPQDATRYNCSRGSPVYAAYAGYVAALYYDEQPNPRLQGLRIEHTIDQGYAEYVPDLTVWTHYWHMADHENGDSFIDQSIIDLYNNHPRHCLFIKLGAFLGYQGNRLCRLPERSDDAVIVHLHLTISGGDTDSSGFDSTPYLGPQFNSNKPNPMARGSQISYNGNTSNPRQASDLVISSSNSQVNQAVTFSFSVRNHGSQPTPSNIGNSARLGCGGLQWGKGSY